jgi:hypothetical protein
VFLCYAIHLPKAIYLLSDEMPLSTNSEMIVESLQTDFDMEELDMLFFAPPDAIPQAVYQAPVVIVADASTFPSKTAVRKRIYGVCELVYASSEINHALDTGGHSLAPHDFMISFLSPELEEDLRAPMGSSTMIGDQDLFEWYDSFKITLLRAPKHGKFVNVKNAPNEQYLPNLNYIGKDRVDLLVEGKDDKGRPIALTLRYYINVLPREDLSKIVEEGKAWETRTRLCGAGKERRWRISENSLEPATLANWYESPSLQALLSGAKAALAGFADLPGASLGQTTGNQIILDTNAAGHNWFIDYTPYLNEEWLATSNPYEWKAKPGSEAEGYDFLLAMANRFGSLENKMDIYYPVDVDLGTTNTPSVLVAEARQAGRERAVGICSIADNGWNDLPGEIARGYLMRYENKTLQELPPLASFKDIRIVKQAEHGRLILEEGSNGMLLTYLPDEGYHGKEHFEVLVSMGDGFLRIVYYVVANVSLGSIDGLAADQLSDSEIRKFCPEGGWLISLPSSEDDADPANWYYTASLQVLLANAKAALTGFTDLSGASLGQTTGDRITLDTDAADHGWFIDYTPYLNEEWLPTSNPYEWKAKPGSEAEGKMDLLSVLLHEYGHVLGIEHSADQHDAMAATLQPGVRRLPNVEAWLALLNQQNGVPVAQKTAPPLTSPS